MVPFFKMQSLIKGLFLLVKRHPLRNETHLIDDEDALPVCLLRIPVHN